MHWLQGVSARSSQVEGTAGVLDRILHDMYWMMLLACEEVNFRPEFYLPKINNGAARYFTAFSHRLRPNGTMILTFAGVFCASSETSLVAASAILSINWHFIFWSSTMLAERSAVAVYT